VKAGPSARAAALALMVWAALLPAAAQAATVRVPLQLDLPLLREALVQQVYTDPGPTARVLDDGHDCGRLELTEPRLDAQGDKLRLRTVAVARLGSFVLERCTLPLDWSGEIEILLEPHVAPGAASVSFRVVDSNVRRADGSRARITGALWSWIKDAVHPRLASFHVNLERPLSDLRAFLPLVLPDDDSLRTQHLVDSVALANARVAAQGVVVELRFEAPESPLPREIESAPSPPSEEEIARFDDALRRWDAFLTFVLRHAGRDTKEQQARRELLAILLDAREELVSALAEPGSSRETDPVRALFLSTWARLAPALRRLGDELPGEASLRYLSFILGADALQALDQVGPSVGLDISANGLRRLARMLAPAESADPLRYDEAVDPELRELFGFGEPIEPPPAEGDDAARTLRIEWTLVQRTATENERARLRSWVPSAEELDEYLDLVQAILEEAGAQALARTPLEARFEPIYGWMLPATAWKESCWRQLVLRDGKPVPIRSPVGAVGIMQVNVRVWRGFYDPRALARDMAYNARAGAEILLHYLVDYVIPADEHEIGGSLDALARATYSAYNGGPRALRRWRNPNAPAALRAIDEAFWRDYQSVKRDGVPDRTTCFAS
jgi:hypothetical protein